MYRNRNNKNRQTKKNKKIRTHNDKRQNKTLQLTKEEKIEKKKIGQTRELGNGLV